MFQTFLEARQKVFGKKETAEEVFIVVIMEEEEAITNKI